MARGMVPLASQRRHEIIEQDRIFDNSLMPTNELFKCGFTNGLALFFTTCSFLENLGKTLPPLHAVFVSAI